MSPVYLLPMYPVCTPYGNIDWGASSGFCAAGTDRLYTGYFNEDDREDLVCNRNDGSLQVDFAVDNGFAGADWLQDGRYFCQGGDDRLIITDINGDALDDLLCINQQTGNIIAEFADKQGVFEKSATEILYEVEDLQGPFGEWCKDGAKLYAGNFDDPKGRDDLLCIEPSGTFKTQLSMLVRNDIEDFGNGAVWNVGFPEGDQPILVGDFNGDRRDDLVRLTQGSEADVFMALSDGQRFVDDGQWHDYFSISTEVPRVGDFNGDGLDDLVTFVRDTKTGSEAGDVWVVLSEGDRFSAAVLWHENLAFGDEQPEIGDFNGDGFDDVVVFVKSARSDVLPGDVWVALSDGSGHFTGPVRWRDGFAVDASDQPAVGDVNGDGMDDIWALAADPGTAGEARPVWVAVSTGESFGPKESVYDNIDVGERTLFVADYNNDGYAEFAELTPYFKFWITESFIDRFTKEAWEHKFGDSALEYVDPGRRVLLADVNRDGLVDLVSVSSKWDFIEVNLNGETISFGACGDGVINRVSGGSIIKMEECDDGNLDNGDGCSALCRLEPVCTPENAVDVGAPYMEFTVDTFGCYKIGADLPADWGTRPLKMIGVSPDTYPLEVVWGNACSGSSGAITLESAGDADEFHVVSNACSTIIGVRAPWPGSQTTLEYEPLASVDLCTELSADDMGQWGTDITVPTNGCLKITQYPDWWDVHRLHLQTVSGSVYPVPFTVSNPCGAVFESDVFLQNWQSLYFDGVSENCPTLIDLNGVGGNLTLRYFAG